MFNLVAAKVFAFCFLFSLLAYRFGPVYCVAIFITFINVKVLPIDQDTNGAVFAENASLNLVNSRSQNQNAGLVFFPEKILRNCIRRLSLPWYQASRPKVSTLPRPSANNV
jgi:hypothetical protein